MMTRLLFLVSLMALPALAQEKQATPAKELTVREGFRAELVRSAAQGEDSWISMTFDDRGRIIVGLDSVGLARLTLGETGEVAFEKIDDTLKHCRGVLFAYGALYVNATDSQEFWRLRDADGDGRFEDRTVLKKLDYRSRFGHGPNQITLGPDGLLYLVMGNDTAFPDGLSPASPFRNPQKDWLLPNPADEGQDDRVGYILRTDKDGQSWEVLAGGFRNQMDVAFNSDGEMFTWDADMEWDVGLPWYRPTRLNHVVSAGDYGWRWGTGKWPAFYPDSLPATLDTGLGSPTGMVFGTQLKFPDRFRRALFMADWQNGRILAVHLTPKGASYTVESESFLEGGPMNVSDMVVGPDGALYFITGGRGSQSGLYRVTHTGKSVPDETRVLDRNAVEARALRHRLEQFHSRTAREAVDLAWPHLSSADPWIRHAARVAIERQNPELWQARVWKEKQPMAAAQGVMALARVSDKNQREALAALGQIELGDLGESEMLAVLRAYALSCIRCGRPDNGEAIGRRLAPLYPHKSRAVNHVLLELLVYLQTPGTPAAALKQLADEPSQEEQIFIVHTLTSWPDDWSMAQNRALLEWLVMARGYRGGRLFAPSLKLIEDAVLKRLSKESLKTFSPLIDKIKAPPPPPAFVVADFVKQWKLADFQDVRNEPPGEYSAASGQRAAARAMCLMCHRVGGQGGQGGIVGPDLSTVGQRFDARALLESILEPSKEMDPKYRYTTYLLTDGRVLTGRVASVSGDTLTLEVNPFTQEMVAFNRADIHSTQLSNISPMPDGLINVLTREEVLSLLAWLRGTK